MTANNIHARAAGAVARANRTDILTAEVANGVLYVTLNRPERHNALSRATIAELAEVFALFAQDETLSVAVLTGAGDKSFAAGGDLKDLEAVRTEDDAAAMSRETRAAFDRIRTFPVPVVAALNGTAVGGGAELACACDFRIAALRAKIGFVQSKMGLTTGWGGGLDLAAIVGSQAALRLTLTAEILDPSAALAIGLYDAVAEEGALEAAVTIMTDRFRALPRPVLASFKLLNRALRAGADRAALETLETDMFARSWVGQPHWDAVAAFNARRKT